MTMIVTMIRIMSGLIDIKMLKSRSLPHKVGPGSPLEVFKLFFTTELLQMIVSKSNRYAREVMGDRKYETWKSG